MEQPMIVIAGPTAVGKTELALQLAEHLKTPIISADSVQVYKYLNIGAAKPTLEEQERVKHLLIDLVEPNVDFSVADYQQHFTRALAEVEQQGSQPLLVGGTGFYIRAVTQVFSLDNVAEPNEQIRAELRNYAAEHGNESLHRRLVEVDPTAAERIHYNDIFRVIRALEVFRLSGRRISELQQKGELKRPLKYIFLNRDRAELYERINKRVEAMIDAGLVDEVQNLLNSGYTVDLKAMQTLGYKQIAAYLNGEITLDVAIEEMKQRTRNYAKRQISWFKAEPVGLELNLSETTDVFTQILQFIA